MKAIAARILKNLVGMLITKHMIFWGLELATKQTKNKVDDNVVGVVKAAYNNNDKELRESVEKILTELK